MQSFKKSVSSSAQCLQISVAQRFILQTTEKAYDSNLNMLIVITILKIVIRIIPVIISNSSTVRGSTAQLV